MVLRGAEFRAHGGRKRSSLDSSGPLSFLPSFVLAHSLEKEAREIKSCYHLIPAQKLRRGRFPQQQSGAVGELRGLGLSLCSVQLASVLTEECNRNMGREKEQWALEWALLCV